MAGGRVEGRALGLHFPVEAIARDIDPRLLDAFRYAFSDARRREVVGGDAACSAASSSRWRGH